MQSNSQANNSQANDNRVNTSPLHETKKTFTQPQQLAVKIHQVTGEHLCSSEQQSSSERMNRGGGDQVAARRLYIYTYTAP